MGTLSFPALVTEKIESTTGSIRIGETTFPDLDDSAPRATACFGCSEGFLVRSKRQEVTASSAVIGIGISVVGVNFDGPVSLTFADDGVDINDLHVVDEGGFCSETNKITVTTVSGTTEVSRSFSSMRLRISGGEAIPEAVAPVVNSDGSMESDNLDGSKTVVDAEGNSTTTLVEGGQTTTQEILADGTSVLIVAQSNGSSATTTVLADGTKIDETQSSNGNKTSYTVLPDGSTVQAEVQNNGQESSFTTLADGSTIDVLKSSNGNTSEVTVSPEGNVETKVQKTNGSVENSTVNVDGSSYSFVRKTNGTITIENVDIDGTKVSESYVPWQSYYTVTTTPPGTSETRSPNPYAA